MATLGGPVKWAYFYLYVILDVFSRCTVGWMDASRESAILAKKLIRETCAKQGIPREQLTLHADCGSRHEVEGGGLRSGGSEARRYGFVRSVASHSH